MASSACDTLISMGSVIKNRSTTASDYVATFSSLTLDQLQQAVGAARDMRQHAMSVGVGKHDQRGAQIDAQAGQQIGRRVDTLTFLVTAKMDSVPNLLTPSLISHFLSFFYGLISCYHVNTRPRKLRDRTGITIY